METSPWHAPSPPDGWKHAAVDRSGVVVFTVGGWDFLPPLLWGRVRFPVCLLVFLACRRGVGVGDAPTPLAPQPGCRGVAKRLPNAHPSPGSRLCSGTGEHAWAPPSSPPPCALRLRPPCSSGTGPVATGSRRRRLVLRLSQKDALQALFQQNPYPGIATRERLARELGIAESRVQVGPRVSAPVLPFRLSMPIRAGWKQLAASLLRRHSLCLPLGLVPKPTQKAVQAEPIAA